jgi:hypothetical protein
MAKKRMARSVVVFTFVLGAGPLLAPVAHAAPECKGVIQCWDERVRECLRNLTLPPGRC